MKNYEIRFASMSMNMLDLVRFGCSEGEFFSSLANSSFRESVGIVVFSRVLGQMPDVFCWHSP